MTSTILHTNSGNPLSLTEAAAEHIQQKLNALPEATGFRLATQDAGCNSKKYVPSYESNAEPDDLEFIDHNISIFIKKSDLIYIAGTEIDYVKDGINKVLKYNNPNVTTACGCGESFNIK
jgi:iron-sulfur cluster assembly protein